jgi:Spy/CpxP family protein refolding chaperone
VTRRLVLFLTLAGLITASACHTGSSSAAQPAPTTSTASADGVRDGRGGPRGRGGRADEMLLRGITLSTDQQQRIDTIRTRYRAQMDQMRQQSSGDRTAMRDQMRTTLEREQAEMRAVLTDDQARQFDQNVAEMRARTQQGGRRGGGQPPL